VGEIAAGIVGSAGTAIVGLLIVGIVSWVKRRVKLTGPTVETLAAQGKQLATQHALVFMLVGIQKPVLLALLGILSALKDKMNGDFERAHKGLLSALNDFDQTVMAIVSGECKGEKPS
jgi:uncharacterized iron-regulated membrane protein